MYLASTCAVIAGSAILTRVSRYFDRGSHRMGRALRLDKARHSQIAANSPTSHRIAASPIAITIAIAIAVTIVTTTTLPPGARVLIDRMFPPPAFIWY